MPSVRLPAIGKILSLTSEDGVAMTRESNLRIELSLIVTALLIAVLPPLMATIRGEHLVFWAVAGPVLAAAYVGLIYLMDQRRQRAIERQYDNPQ